MQWKLAEDRWLPNLNFEEEDTFALNGLNFTFRLNKLDVAPCIYVDICYVQNGTSKCKASISFYFGKLDHQAGYAGLLLSHLTLGND